MIPGQFFDLTAWIENYWIPLVLAATVGAAAAAWRWWSSRRSARHMANAEARLVASREFARVATQFRALRMYEFGSGLRDLDGLAKKQDECLEIILLAANGPAAKVARNAGGATLPRLGVTATSTAVGNLELFALAYKRAQLEYMHEHTAAVPSSRLDPKVWARTYDFASRVLDPHRLTFFGFLRLALRSTHRFEDTLRVEGHTLERRGLWRRLKWIYSMSR